MKALTLRGIDDELERALRDKSRELGTPSLNNTILRVLRESLGLTKRRHAAAHRDLDHLAGTWTEADLKEFEKATAALSQIDGDLWHSACTLDSHFRDIPGVAGEIRSP